jgi:hypothetical protein
VDAAVHHVSSGFDPSSPKNRAQSAALEEHQEVMPLGILGVV